MPTAHLTVRELKDMDPKRFDKEYYHWCEYTGYDGWAECIEGDFRTRHAPQGVEAYSIWFSLHGQGSYACFSGVVHAAKLMKHLKLDEEYLPMYLAMESDGSRFSVSGSWRGGIQVEFDGVPWDTEPTGVFSTLDQEAWENLLNEQLNESDLEEVVQSFCDDICHELHKELEQEYEHMTSEESFIESCEINEVTFEIEIEGDEK
jgi:hypothetical protein